MEGEGVERASRMPPHTDLLKLVGKLIDGYLAEVALDANLKVHPWMREKEKERIYGVMDCRRLTLEACTHATQYERLPLRVVVHVLFFEQLQLRRVIAGMLLMAEGEAAAPSAVSVVVGGRAGGDGGGSTWRMAMYENQVMCLDMDNIWSRVQELECECSSMKKALAKLAEGDDGEGSGGGGGERKESGGGEEMGDSGVDLARKCVTRMSAMWWS
ncbi:hypothetical protein Cni_G26088 [Canna indica]|uniref:NPH3 domain-containing protein n=1 Tax=Canna indica TaxID=4628 RepID=A0AAQ3L5F9_9LILI|nr:hypothetical protein Cni_G26088 [Canna indica]